MLLKKSLTHAGVLISLIILVVLMLFNWDKCFVNPIAKWLEPAKIPPAQSTKKQEGFENAIPQGIDTRDIELDLNPTARQVKISFTGVVAPSEYAVKSYLLVMAKYDKDLNKVGSMDVKLSEEAGGQTLYDNILAFTKKYSGTLTTDRQTKIKSLSELSDISSSDVMNSFIGTPIFNNKTLVDLSVQPTQEIPMFFELLDIIYKHQLTRKSAPKNLKTIYRELQYIYTDLPIETIPVPTGKDKNYDYLELDTDNLKAAADLKIALANFPALKNALSPTGDVAGKPKKIVIDALRAYINELIRNIETSLEVVSGNICDPTTNKCTYTFTQVEPADPQGNIYYYKLGIGVIYVKTATGDEKISKINAYSFGSGNKLQYFRVDTNIADQERLLKRLAELETVSAQKALQQPSNGDTSSLQSGSSSQMDAYLNMLKPYLGNYPDEYLLGTAEGKELTLDKYLNQSLASGQININADLSGLTPKTTAMAASV